MQHRRGSAPLHPEPPLAVESENDRTRVVARVAGNFPGSPLDLTYRFRLDGDRQIRALEIG